MQLIENVAPEVVREFACLPYPGHHEHLMGSSWSSTRAFFMARRMPKFPQPVHQATAEVAA